MVASAKVGEEVVLLDARSGALRTLDPLGGLVWACFDGASTIDEIVTDLSEEFKSDRDAVRRDVIDLTRTLARDGLLDVVALQSEAAAEDERKPSQTGRKADERRFLELPPTA